MVWADGGGAIRINTVIVIGKKCADGARCGIYVYDQIDPANLDYWLYGPMTINAIGDQNTASALRKFADYLSTAKDACLKSGE